MIDLHCHLLPGIDDGPQNLEDALALARALVADGVAHAVLTPHVFPGRYTNVRSSIATAHAAFSQVLAAQQIPLRTSYAGEVRVTPEVLDLLPSGELPCLDGPHGSLRTLLLELPDEQIPLGTDRFIAHLQRSGHTPLIAHPERNKGVMDKPERLRPLIDMGCLTQVTAGSLLGEFGTRAKETARTLLDNGWVHVVANDAHHTRRRAPRMSPARLWVEQRYGASVAQRLFVTEPGRLCGISSTGGQVGVAESRHAA